MSTTDEVREQSIYRVVKNKDFPYFPMLRKNARKKELSFKARGILTLMLSYPDNWAFNFQHLMSMSERDGKDSLRSGLQELEDTGHVKLIEIREQGRFARYEYQIFEDPDELSPLAGNPPTENPLAENPPLKKIDNTNTDIKKKEEAKPLPPINRADEFRKPVTPKRKKNQEKKFSENEIVNYPKEFSELGRHFEKLIQRAPTSSSEFAFWVYGRESTGAKGLKHFKKHGITTDAMTSAFDKLTSGRDGITVASPNTLFNTAFQIQSNMNKGVGVSMETIEKEREKAREEMRRLKSQQKHAVAN